MGEDKINRRQMLAAAFVALLSPVARRIPSGLVMVSGPAAWLAAPIAAVPVVIMIAFMARMLRGGRGLGEVFALSLGKRLGGLAVGAVSLWLLFYCGFILRSAAYRFTSTVYPSTAGWIFIVFSALCCLPIAMGRFSAIARLSVLLRPLLIAVLTAVFIFSLGDCRLRGVLAISEENVLPALHSGFTVLNTLSVVCYLGFAERRCSEDFRPRQYVLWALVLLAIVEMLCLSCLGVFGAELTTKLNFPFFMLVRDISIFDSFARMEALVIALWMFADAVHISLLLHIASENLGRLLRRSRKATAALCTLGAAGAGLAIPSDMLAVGLFSEKIVPAGNAIIIFGLLPLVFALGWIRRKL